MRTLQGHTRVSGVAVTPDGRQAISASYDNTLKVWDLASGAEVRTLPGHTGTVYGVAVTPDGRQAISASWDNTLKVWDLASGAEVRTLPGHTAGSRRGGDARRPPGHLRLRGQHAQGLGPGQRRRSAHPAGPHGRGQRRGGDARRPPGHLCLLGQDAQGLGPGHWPLSRHVPGRRSIDACAVAPDGLTIVAGGASGRVHFLRLGD